MAIFDGSGYDKPQEIGQESGYIPIVEINESKSFATEGRLYYVGRRLHEDGIWRSYTQSIFGDFDLSSTSKFLQSYINSFYTTTEGYGMTRIAEIELKLSDLLNTDPFQLKIELLKGNDMALAADYSD